MASYPAGDDHFARKPGHSPVTLPLRGDCGRANRTRTGREDGSRHVIASPVPRDQRGHSADAPGYALAPTRDALVRATTAVSGATPASSAQASTIRARWARDCDAVRLRTSASRASRSPSVTSSGTSVGSALPKPATCNDISNSGLEEPLPDGAA